MNITKQEVNDLILKVANTPEAIEALNILCIILSYDTNESRKYVNDIKLLTKIKAWEEAGLKVKLDPYEVCINSTVEDKIIYIDFDNIVIELFTLNGFTVCIWIDEERYVVGLSIYTQHYETDISETYIVMTAPLNDGFKFFSGENVNFENYEDYKDLSLEESTVKLLISKLREDSAKN